MPATGDVEELLRPLAPQVLAALTRRHGRFDACEDAVQEALLAATLQWPRDGVPAKPRGWLLTVASRRLIDEVRAERARGRREEVAGAVLAAGGGTPAEDERPSSYEDTVTLLFLCCHPALSEASQIALTLRAVGGLGTTEIAAAFLVPEATMAQRISRAKQTIREVGLTFDAPPPEELPQRLRAVLHVLYLIFNEGYTASSGPEVQRVELAAEAIRLCRTLYRLMPGEGEVQGLLALMLLTHARRQARTGTDGSLIPLADQDRSRWDADAIAEGTALVSDALSRAKLGPYQLQAAIAAIHDEAPTAEATDWRQIVALYRVLERLAPNPVFTLGRAVAVGMSAGPEDGLAALAEVEDDPRLARSHRVDAVRAHLLEMAGRPLEAGEAYARAARRTMSLAEQRYLETRATRARAAR